MQIDLVRISTRTAPKNSSQGGDRASEEAMLNMAEHKAPKNPQATGDIAGEEHMRIIVAVIREGTLRQNTPADGDLATGKQGAPAPVPLRAIPDCEPNDSIVFSTNVDACVPAAIPLPSAR